MILYLCKENKIELLNFIYNMTYEEKEKIKVPTEVIKTLVGTFCLKEFVQLNFRNYENCKYLIVDYNCLKNNKEEIFVAMKSLKMMSKVKIALLVEYESMINKTSNFELIVLKNSKKENEEKVLNFLSETKAYNVEYEIEEKNLNKNNITELEEVQKEFFWTCKNKKVSMLGINEKTDITLITLNLANCLNKLGAKVLIIDNTNDFKMISRVYKLEEDKVCNINGIDFCNQYSVNVANKYNFIIYNCNNENNSTENLINLEEKILVGSLLPYQLREYITATELYKNEKVTCLGLFCTEETKKYLGKEIVEIKTPSSLFDDITNWAVFFNLFEKYTEEKKEL